MIDVKKYMTTIIILLSLIIVLGLSINIFISSLANLFIGIIDIFIIAIIVVILYSMIITINVIKDKPVSNINMKINFKIVNILLPIMNIIARITNTNKNELRKVYIKLNNKYIYSDKYSVRPEEILILIPHCVQKNSCKIKVTTDINTCIKCGMCNIGELVKLREDKNVSIFVATGGTLARKIIIDRKPKAIIAVACERDLTAGVKDVKGIPVLGVFNKRPNGPCVDTSIDIEEIKKAVDFFTSNSN